jgi:signal peptidase II
VIAGLDQATKELALRSLDDGPTEVIPGVLDLRLTYNTGGAFGLLQGVPGFFLVATVLVVGVIVLWARHIEKPIWAFALGAVLGGGLGNLIDRVVRDTPGVVDFVDLQVWPIFNLADAAIVSGVIAVMLLNLRDRPVPSEDPRDRPEPEENR